MEWARRLSPAILRRLPARPCGDPGFANGLPDPIQPISLVFRAISISGGLFQFIRTREELLRRADDVLDGIREGWLRLHIDEVFPLAKAAEAQRRLENRESTGKIILQISTWLRSSPRRALSKHSTR